MSADLDLILGKIENLSREDLVTLRQNIDTKLYSTNTNDKSNGKGNKGNGTSATVSSSILPETQAEQDAIEFYESIFTPEELAEMLGVAPEQFNKLTYPMVAKIVAQTDMSNLLNVSLGDAVNQDREDRFW